MPTSLPVRWRASHRDCLKAMLTVVRMSFVKAAGIWEAKR